MLHKVLSQAENVEMHHEYMVHIVQPLAVKRYLGLAGADEAKRVLQQTHGAAARYSQDAHWGDSSNKLSWLVRDLAEILPKSKFVHLVRDGRKVASSYFHKLGNECYDDRSTAVLASFLRDPAHVPAPPPEKKYWWPQPPPSDPSAGQFARFDQFERISWHWAEINRFILAALAELPRERQLFMRLEELENRADAVQSLFSFLGLAYRDAHFAMFARPHNVNRPEDRLLDAGQTEQFNQIAGPMLERLGYANQPEYVVNY